MHSFEVGIVETEYQKFHKLTNDEGEDKELAAEYRKETRKMLGLAPPAVDESIDLETYF